MMTQIRIFDMELRHNHKGETSDIVAEFRADIGPFRVQRAYVRRRHDGELMTYVTGNRGDGRGITLYAGSPEWQRASDMALAEYRGRAGG